MDGWLSDEEFHAQENAYRRRRLIRLIRGWLRESREPLTVGFIVWLAPITFGLGAAALVEFTRGPVAAWIWGIIPLLAWPISVALLRWHACVEARRFDPSLDIEVFLAADNANEARKYEENRGGWLGDTIDDLDAPWYRSDGTGTVIFVTIAILVGGLGLIFHIWQQHANHVAETMVDAEILVRHPELKGHVEAKPWLAGAFSDTALAFVAPASILLVAFGIWHRVS